MGVPQWLDGLSMVIFRDNGYDIRIYGGFLKWGVPQNGWFIYGDLYG